MVQLFAQNDQFHLQWMVKPKTRCQCILISTCLKLSEKKIKFMFIKFDLLDISLFKFFSSLLTTSPLAGLLTEGITVDNN